MKYSYINKKRIYGFESKNNFLNYITEKKTILIALNAEKLINKNKELEEIINQNIGYPDGIGAVLALTKKGVKSIKIAGAEFWLDIIERFETEKSFYIIGSSEVVINNTVSKLKEEYPNIQLKGYRNGFLKEEDKVHLLEEFKELKPDVIFVAQGSPRQEILMSYFMQEYPALYMGLGGSFDVYSGLKKRAPKFFIKFGLEWLYRLLKEPTRLKRQFALFKFAISILTNRI